MKFEFEIPDEILNELKTSDLPEIASSYHKATKEEIDRQKRKIQDFCVKLTSGDKDCIDNLLYAVNECIIYSEDDPEREGEIPEDDHFGLGHEMADDMVEHLRAYYESYEGSPDNGIECVEDFDCSKCPFIEECTSEGDIEELTEEE